MDTRRLSGIALLLSILVGLPLDTLKADTPRVPKEVYDICKGVVDNLGLKKQEQLFCGSAPRSTALRKRTSTKEQTAQSAPRKTFIYELDEHSPLRIASEGAGILELTLADGGSIKCMAAAITTSQLITTTACGDKLASGPADDVSEAIAHLGTSGKGVDGPEYRSDYSISKRPPRVRMAVENLSILDFDSGAEAAPTSVPIPKHGPSDGDALIAYDPATARYLTHCTVTIPVSEDLSRFGYDCSGGRQAGANWKSGDRILLFDAKDRSLVGFSLAPSTDGEPRFASVRAMLTTSDAGRLLVGDAKRVLGCYNAGGGHRTIQEMFDCSGVWVTPKALLRCAMGTQCPVYADDVVGRAGMEAALGGMKLDTPLVLRAEDIPPQPSRAVIDQCNSSEADAPAFTKCVIDKSTTSDFAGFMECIRTNEGSKQAGCITAKTGDALLSKVVACLDGAAPSSMAILRCSNDSTANAAFETMSKCAKGATDQAGVAGCLFTSAPKEQRRIAECVASTAGRAKVDCLRSALPELARAGKVIDCLNDVDGNELSDATDCVGGELPGDVGKVAGCLGNPDRETAAMCLLGDKPEVKAAAQIYRCTSMGRDVASVLANCTQGLGLDPKSQQALSCTASAGADRARLLACAGQLALPPEAARLVGCAASGGGPTGFALCASGPIMNEEWRIAAECAVESGGQPYATAACAATRLTIRELTACFKGQVGKDCFGPNNTIVKAVTNAFNDVVHGPGKNNEVVKAIASINEGIERLSPEAAKLIERPLGSDQALIPKARDDLLNGLHIGGTGRKIIENPINPFSWF